MDKIVDSTPANEVAVEVKKVSLGNNLFQIVPLSVHMGKTNDDGTFTCEDNLIRLGSILDIDYFDGDDNTYLFKVSFSELHDKYEEDTVDKLLYRYFEDICNNVIYATKDDDKINVYNRDYTFISEELTGSFHKVVDGRMASDETRKIIAVPQVIVPQFGDDSLEYLKHIDVLDLEKYLKERIFSNDDVLEDLVTTIAMNYRASDKKDVQAILCMGTTGTGKTETMNLVSEYLRLPLTIYDSNSLTASGYVGKDIEDVLSKVYENSGRDKNKAEKSIVVFDEIDKLAARGMEVKDLAVQYLLLKFLDGYNYTVAPNKNTKPFDIDTSFMTVVGLGAFPEIFEAKKNKKAKNGIGFGASMGSEIEESELMDVTTEDLVKTGNMLAELMGRFGNKFVYRTLDADSYRKIFLYSVSSPLKRKIEKYKDLFGVEVVYDDKFIDALVEATVKKNSGGRAMSAVVDATFKKVDRELLINSNSEHAQKVLKITADTVYNPKNFHM